MSETGFLYILITGIAFLLFAVVTVFAFRNRPDAVVRDESKPCKGMNGNICVAEGCYGEACIKK
jgi:hypothetical protein